MNFEKELKKQILKLKTKEEKMIYIENIRFLIAADEVDYQNYYFDKELSESEFYSIVDMLYLLDNFYMLSTFTKKNGKYILDDLKENGENELFSDYVQANTSNLSKRFQKFQHIRKQAV